jgi:glutamate---cysteine ligase / carboxylate-amine ligase
MTGQGGHPSREWCRSAAVLIRGLTQAALNTSDDEAPDLSNEILRAQLWRAARDGLAGRCPHPRTGDPVAAQSLVNELLVALAPILRENDDLDFAGDQITRLATTGGGADRQRQIFSQTSGAARVADMLAVAPASGHSLAGLNPGA